MTLATPAAAGGTYVRPTAVGDTYVTSAVAQLSEPSKKILTHGCCFKKK